MRVAAIYDIHGNLPALEAVIADIREAQVDHPVVGGDVVPGPMPRETLECLLRLSVSVDFIQGNGEAAVLADIDGRDAGKLPELAREAVRWFAQQLHPEDQKLLEGWPKTLQMQIPGLGEVLCCHAAPRSDIVLLLRPNIELRRTTYDLAKAAERVRQTTYSQAEDFAANNILQPPSEKQMLELFARAEVR
jgi:hypothetical protein